MKVLDSKTVVVSNSDELKEILEEDNTYSYIYLDSDDTITITASSIEELIKKIEDYTQNEEVNNVQTKEEKAVGQHIDFKG